MFFFRMKFQCYFVSGFGLPPTPPSSLSSDDSEDNQSAEVHTISSSPSSSMSYSPNSSMTQQTVTKANSQSANSPNSSRGYTTSGTRQPIHTPLISNQPVRIRRSTALLNPKISQLNSFTNYRKDQPANWNWLKKRSEHWSLKVIPSQPDYLSPSPRKSHSKRSGEKLRIRWVQRLANFASLALINVCGHFRFQLKRAEERRKSTWTNWSVRWRCLSRRTTPIQSASKRSKKRTQVSWINWPSCKR